MRIKTFLTTLAALLLGTAVVAGVAGAGPRPPLGDPARVRNDPPANQLKPHGGPFVDERTATQEALRMARGMGATDARVTSVRLVTYAESAQLNAHGIGQSLHPQREVYVVYVSGAVTNRRGPRTVDPQTFMRTFWVFDAPTGEFVGWGSAP